MNRRRAVAASGGGEEATYLPAKGGDSIGKEGSEEEKGMIFYLLFLSVK